MIESATTPGTRDAYLRAHEARGEALRAIFARLFHR